MDWRFLWRARDGAVELYELYRGENTTPGRVKREMRLLIKIRRRRVHEQGASRLNRDPREISEYGVLKSWWLRSVRVCKDSQQREPNSDLEPSSQVRCYYFSVSGRSSFLSDITVTLLPTLHVKPLQITPPIKNSSDTKTIVKFRAFRAKPVHY